ncbi:MAG TPA: response regulator transcription factor [Actinomycetota bacterium]|jgi:RNA polymerase sigma factor (sigma-70 family)|nr:response regulator transcription factor [Actinomycetota bacterium]
MSRKRAIRVLIADDHRTFAEALRTAIDLEEGLKVTGIASDGNAAVEMASGSAADVVLMDVEMPRKDGIAATREIVAARPEARVIMLTAHESDALVGRALEAGAAGYLSKDRPMREVARAVRTAFEGRPLIDPEESDRLLQRFRQRREAGNAARTRVERLTPRETEILQRLADGLSQEEIAAILGISRHTLRTHLQNILTKLRVRSRLEALAEAVRYGKVRLEAEDHPTDGSPG